MESQWGLCLVEDYITHEWQCWDSIHGFFLHNLCFSNKPCYLHYNDCWTGGGKITNPKTKQNNTITENKTTLAALRTQYSSVRNSLSSFRVNPHIQEQKRLRSKGELRSTKCIKWAGYVCLCVTFVVYSSIHSANACESQALYQAQGHDEKHRSYGSAVRI